MKLGELSKRLGLELVGDSEWDISAPATLDDAKNENISFYHSARYGKQLKKTEAGAVILPKKELFDGAKFTALISNNVLDDFRRAVEILVPSVEMQSGISENAKIDSGAKIGKNVRIEDFVAIGNAKVGDGTIIGVGAVVGDGVSMGSGCRIYPRVVIYDGVVIGSNVIVHAGAVLGSDGFGYSRTEDGTFHKIPQVGGLIIGDDVEIGANTAIDRGSLGNTVIGSGTKIDNLVQIGHNVILGNNCALAGQVGIAGSSKLGNGVLMGGQAGLSGHIELADGVVVYAQAGVDKSFGAGITILGSPARPARETLRQWAAVAKLPEIIAKMRRNAKDK